MSSLKDDAERRPSGVPLPPGARVRRLDPHTALIELPEPVPAPPPWLTEAEADVARAVFEGASNQQIAAARGVGVKTVSKQLEAIYRKLGVGSRVELVLALREERLEEPLDDEMER